MLDYVILTDSASDLTKEKAAEADVQIVDLNLTVEENKTVKDNDMDKKELYVWLRAKHKVNTSAVNIDDFINAMTPHLEAGKDILYLGFSSSLSSTYASGKCAAEELSEKYPERKIYTVDTLCASLGEGLLVCLAAKLRKEGWSIDKVRDFAESNKLRLCHWFTVDDLFYLKRGGRVGAASAVIGTVLGIKPVMHMDNEGNLVKVGTVRGRKAALDSLFSKLKSTITGVLKDATVFICHGDCRADAEYVADRLRNEMGIRDIFIGFVGAVIGSHSGPGTLSLFYLGTER